MQRDRHLASGDLCRESAPLDPALGQQILDVAQRQRVSHVHHHDQTDDLWRAVEMSERIAHAPRLTQPGQPENLL
jgi:hypothetical protein